MIAAFLLAATLSAFDQVVASERAFAAASLEQGLHEAFLANLAEESIVFDPAPVPGRAAHQDKPPSKGRLSWGPAWVAASSAGDLALSTGPWEFRLPEDAATPPRTGWFFSVWRRQQDGAWKVALDAGVSTPLEFSLPSSVENGFAGAPATFARATGAAKARRGMTTSERAFTAAAKSGIGAAVAARTDPRARVYRDGKAIAVGSEAARALLDSDKREATCVPDRVIGSASGDLGYAYGTCAGAEGDVPPRYGFLHVWRKQSDGSWKILIDVTP